MTRLAAIEGAGIRCLDAPFRVDLPERGLVQVRGPSGVGKSTLLSAIAYVLGHGPPATRLQSWFGTALEATLVFQDGPAETRIVRAGRLRVGDSKGNAAAQEEALAKLLPVPLAVVERLAWRRQRKGSEFLLMSDEDKKIFLSLALGFENHEENLEAGKARVAEAERVLERAGAALAQATAVRDALGTPPDVGGLQEAAAAAQDEMIGGRAAADRAATALKRAVQDASDRIEAWRQEQAMIRAGLTARKQRVAATVVPTPETEAAAVQEVRERLELCRSALGDLRFNEQARRRTWEEGRRAAVAEEQEGRIEAAALGPLAKRIDEVQHELQHLQGATCPTCRRAWPEAGGETLSQTRQRLENLQRDHQLLKGGAERRAGAVARWEAANPWVPNETLRTLEVAEGVLGQRLAAAQATLQAASREAARGRDRELADIERELAGLGATPAPVHPDLDRLNGEHRLACVTALTLEEAYRRACRAVTDGEALEQRVMKAGEARDRAVREELLATKKRDEEADTLDAVRAFVGRLFDELLLEAADEVDRMLVEVPNVRHCRFSFRSEVVSKKGATRQAIVPVLLIGKHELIGDLEACGASGGMRSAIELAVDLGILRVLERRLGRVQPWLVVDEALEGLPPACREACFELLRAEATRRLVLVVDHVSEVGGLADRTIDVVPGPDGRATVRG